MCVSVGVYAPTMVYADEGDQLRGSQSSVFPPCAPGPQLRLSGAEAGTSTRCAISQLSLAFVLTICFPRCVDGLRGNTPLYTILTVDFPQLILVMLFHAAFCQVVRTLVSGVCIMLGNPAHGELLLKVCFCAPAYTHAVFFSSLQLAPWHKPFPEFSLHACRSPLDSVGGHRHRISFFPV